jgi:Fungal specific transcription factor domain
METWPTPGLEGSQSRSTPSMFSSDLPESSYQKYDNRQNYAEISRSSDATPPKFQPSTLGVETSRPSYAFSRRSISQESMSPETSAANQILALSMAGSNMATSPGYVDTGFSSPVPNQFHRGGLSHLPTPLTSASSDEINSNIDHPKQIRKFPLINETARESVLTLIDRGRPQLPGGLRITRDHPLLSLLVLQDYCNLYFTRFNNTYPLLHQATFDPALVDPLLLTSILLLGATYSDRVSHLVAMCVHDTMRVQVLGSPDFTSRPPLWILQTILLLECFGKFRAGQLQYDMSDLFHNVLIK